MNVNPEKVGYRADFSDHKRKFEEEIDMINHEHIETSLYKYVMVFFSLA